MVLGFYNLKQEPFGVTPNPRFLYMSGSHREALASLMYGIHQRRGFMSLVAEPGMGKTTILFKLLEQLKASARTAYLFQTLCQPRELLRAMLRGLGIAEDGADTVRMQERLNSVLVEEARNKRTVVVVIDEAQNLDYSSLELIRMLSNFETSDHKLIQIVLAGQPQLRGKLASPHLVQLRQRMAINARLCPFDAEETHLYIQHRLEVAGYTLKHPLFTPQAEALIARYSDGIPRNINNICFNSLALGCVSKKETIDAEIIREVLDDLNIALVHSEDVIEQPIGRSLADQREVHRKVLRWPVAARKRLAFVPMLLMLLMPINGRTQKPHTAQAPPAVAISQVLAKDVKQAEPVSPPVAGSPAPLAVSTSSEMQTQRDPNNSLSTGSQYTMVVSSGPTLTKQSKSASALNTNPVQLWAEVRTGNSDAEVKLAQMYLQGMGVQQNCDQAQVLLLTASRRGNIQAADLLNKSVSQCRQ